jgi:hypothetical protein
MKKILSLCLLLLAPGCSSNRDLSRSDAEAKIDAYLKKVGPGFIDLPLSQDAFECGVKQGLLIPNPNFADGTAAKFYYAPSDTRRVVAAFLLPNNGAAIFLKVQAVAVTGIRQGPTRGVRIAEYIWSAEWNMIKAPLKTCFSLPPTPDNIDKKWIADGEATFELYDDGWRLTSITGDPKRDNEK